MLSFFVILFRLFYPEKTSGKKKFVPIMTQYQEKQTNKQKKVPWLENRPFLTPSTRKEQRREIFLRISRFLGEQEAQQLWRTMQSTNTDTKKGENSC